MTLISVLGVFSALGNGAIPFLTGKFFDALLNLSQISPITTIPMWGFLLGIWFIIQIITNTIDWVNDKEVRNLANIVYTTIVTDGYTRLLLLPIGFHKSNLAGEVSSKTQRAGNSISGAIRTLTRFAPQILSVLVGISFVMYIHWAFLIILISGISLYILMMWFTVQPSAFLSRENNTKWNKVFGITHNALANIHAIKQSTAERDAKKMINKATHKASQQWFKLDFLWAKIGFSQRTIVVFTQLVTFITSVFFISQNKISIGDLIALNSYAAMVFGPFSQIAFSWQTLQNAAVNAEIFGKQHTQPTENYTPKDSTKIKNFTGDVSFKDVRFAYEKKQKDVLKGISFEVQEGETVAMVGESGVGKSTAIELISGYYFPQKGLVTVSGVPTNKHDLNKLRQNIAVVSQEPVLFNDTVFKNIKYGSFKATDTEVKRAAREAQADEFIKEFPKKYKQVVGERGVKLSGGQKQRIAIARAMLRDPKILILDEPTSALDAKTEHGIAESLEKLMKGRTTFIIAHRLSTVRKADKIIVFEKGKVVEQGKHEELLKIKDGVYKRLHDYQVGLY